MSSNTAAFNDPSIGFRLDDTVQGRSRALLRSGVTPTQTPMVLVGAGPFVLTPNELETALITALVLRGGPAFGTVTVQLPSTTSITSIISSVCITNANTSGAWVPLRLINQSSNADVQLLAGDINTTITQQTTQSLTTQVYTLCEVPGGVAVVQDTYHEVRQPRQFFTAQLSAPFIPGAVTGAIPFDTIVNQSPATDQLFFDTGGHTLNVAPGVVVLINVNITITNTQAFGQGPLMAIAPPGQSVSPLTGVIAAMSTFMPALGTNEYVLCTVFTNQTAGLASLQVYLDNVFSPFTVDASSGITSQITATQVAQI